MKAMKPSSPSFNEAFMKATLFFIGPGGGASGALSGSQNHQSSIGFIRFFRFFASQWTPHRGPRIVNLVNSPEMAISGMEAEPENFSVDSLN